MVETPYDEHKDLPFPSDVAEANTRAILLREALETSPSELQDYIAKRTIGNPELWEEVLMGCRGDLELANLLLDRDLYTRQLDDPAYNRETIEDKLRDTKKRIADINTQFAP